VNRPHGQRIRNKLKTNAMDGFSYTNIFETKGIEYLAIIAFLILLIPFWIVLNKQVKFSTRIRHVLGSLSAGILRIPRGLYYSRNHTWTHLERSGSASVGLNDLLMHITGEMSFRNVKNPGDKVNKGELLAEFEQDGKKLRIFSPLSGEVLKVNHSLAGNPELLTEDPYGAGWLYRLKPSDWKSETASFYVAEETTEWLKSELDRFKDFLAVTAMKHSPGNPMAVLQDGGELRDQSLSTMPDGMWQDFQKEFLDPETKPG
jgi:glycine cleavage system H protein